MAAVIEIHTGQRIASEECAGSTSGHRTPRLRVIEGGRSDASRRPFGPGRLAQVGQQVPPRVYLARRLLVGAVLAVALVVAVQMLGSVLVSGAALVDAAPGASGRTYQVRAGDTLWSIAGELAPGLDRRVAVDDLAALNGGADLRVGEELEIPSSFG